MTGDTDAQGGATAKTYDGNFRPGTVTGPAGRITKLGWSPTGANLTSIVDANGAATRLYYDALNNVTRTVDALGFATSYRYSGTLLISQTNALTQTWVYTYNGNRLLVAEQNPLGITRYGYNTFGERTIITLSAALQGQADALGNVTRFGYDSLGRLITTTDALGRIAVNAYDNADQLLAVTQNYTSTSSQPNYLSQYNLVTRYAYDGFGRQLLITDTLGLVTRSGYDTAGRLVSVTPNYSPSVGQNYLNQ